MYIISSKKSLMEIQEVVPAAYFHIFGLLLHRLRYHKLYTERLKPQFPSTIRNICWQHYCHYHQLLLNYSILNTSELNDFQKHFNRYQHFSKYCRNVKSIFKQWRQIGLFVLSMIFPGKRLQHKSR